jgi:hypothetical protein
MPAGRPIGPQPDGKAEHRREGEGGPRSLAYTGMQIGGSDGIGVLRGYSSDMVRNGGFSCRQGIRGPGTHSAQLRVRCGREPPQKLLNAADESLYCFRGSRRSGVVEHPRAPADLCGIGRNYLSVHNLRPKIAQ